MQFAPVVAAGVGYGAAAVVLRVCEKRLQRLANRYGKWLGLSAQDIGKARRWFNKHGNKAVFFCRLVPGVRTLISIPQALAVCHWCHSPLLNARHPLVGGFNLRRILTRGEL